MCSQKSHVVVALDCQLPLATYMCVSCTVSCKINYFKYCKFFAPNCISFKVNEVLLNLNFRSKLAAPMKRAPIGQSTPI